MYKKLFTQAIAGCTVLTGYNNATYRVDNVNFDVTTRSTFEATKKGNVTKISYVDYYLHHMPWAARTAAQGMRFVIPQPFFFDIFDDRDAT